MRVLRWLVTCMVALVWVRLIAVGWQRGFGAWSGLEWFLAIALPLLAVVVVVGWLLPSERTVGSALDVMASPEVIWAVLGDELRLPEWLPECRAVERLPDRAGQSVWRLTPREGMVCTYAREEEPPLRLTKRTLEIRDEEYQKIITEIGYGGDWTTWRLTATPAGCRVELSTTVVGTSAVYRLALWLLPVWRKHRRHLAACLAALAARVAALGAR